jgi:glycosyltransferase involved in cell wall biosynthesis
MVNNKKKILFTASLSSSFIQEDLKLLRPHYALTEIIASGPAAIFRYLFAVPNADLTFSWFASVYSSVVVFLAKVFRKKSIIIIGGADVAKEKEYNYGIWNSWWKARIVRYAITHADLILSVDESLMREAIRLAQYDGKNILVVPTGYDPLKWSRGNTEKKKMVLSIGGVLTKDRFKIKGFDILLRVAAAMPDVPFVIIGIPEELQRQQQIPDNVQCHPFISQEMLLAHFREAKVFCQPSRREGLPNTLCEAMLCECIPVGSDRNGIPKAIGDTGFIVNINDEENIIHEIRAALTADEERGVRARQRIIEKFPLTQRDALLQEAIQSLMQ